MSVSVYVYASVYVYVSGNVAGYVSVSACGVASWVMVVVFVLLSVVCGVCSV